MLCHLYNSLNKLSLNSAKSLSEYTWGNGFGILQEAIFLNFLSNISFLEINAAKGELTNFNANSFAYKILTISKLEIHSNRILISLLKFV